MVNSHYDPRREWPPPGLTVDAGETSAHRIEGEADPLLLLVVTDGRRG